jgi:hypothetical protein
MLIGTLIAIDWSERVSQLDAERLALQLASNITKQLSNHSWSQHRN